MDNSTTLSVIYQRGNISVIYQRGLGGRATRTRRVPLREENGVPFVLILFCASVSSGHVCPRARFEIARRPGALTPTPAPRAAFLAVLCRAIA